MSSLGEIFFSLGLDSQKFDDAIKKAKEKVAELTGEASITINADASNVAAQVQDDLNKITGKKTEIKLGIDKSSKASVEELVKDIANAEKELERLKSKESWNAAAIGRQEGFVANLKRQLEEAKAVKVAATESKEAISNIAQSTQTVQHIVREADINLVRELKEELVGVNEQLELRNRLEQGKRDAADKNKAEREEAARVKAEQKAIENAQKKAAKEEKARIKAEEKAAKDAEREEAARLRRLDKESKAVQNQQLAEQKVLEGRKKMQEEEYNLTRWARKQEVANSSIYESAEYRREQNLLKKQYEDEERAAKAKIANEAALEKAARERAEISAQWIGEQRKHNKEIAKQEAERIRQEEKELELMAKKRKFSADWINNTRTQNEVQKRNETSVSRSELQNQLTQLQRLEEAIKKLQYTKVDIDTSDVDKDSEAYKKAAKALDSYIDKLQEMQSSGKRLKGREVTDAIGIDMNRVIAQSTSSVAEQIRIQRKATVEATRAKKEEEGRVKLVDKLANKLKNSSDWASQLNNQLTNAFSIYSIERFIRNLYTIGGEFQKQQIALQAMIGDADKGNAIFERAKGLAVISPFTFSELSSYTKQMSAYGIEYEELYDTTKRLADISAGVGVDMGRLILAFGQVRSAAVLRGQELRQFTEAGIPLVAELAKRFTELEGKAVSTGEVFDKISKREVSFGMVKDILFDMTDPGGRFFKMQEVQAKSLAGQWSNLKDAWDIMVADIANASNGALGVLSTTIKGILDTWRAWSPVLLGVVGLIGTYSAAIRIAELATSALNLVTNANPWVKVISVVVSATSAIIGYQIATKDATKTIEDLNVEFEKSKATAEDNERTANRYLDILSKSTDKEDEKLQLQRKQQIALEELTRMYEPLFKNMNLESMTLDVIAKKRAEINEMTKNNTLESFRNNRAQMVSMKLSMERELASMEKTNKSNKNPLIDSDFFKSLGGKFNDWFGTSDEDIANKKAEILEITQAISDLDDEVKKTAEAESWEELKKKLTLNSTIDEYVSVYGEIGKAVKILREKGITAPIADPKMGTSVIEYNEELNKLLKEQKGIMDDFDSSTDTYKKAADLSEIYKAAIKSIGGVTFSKKTSGKSEAEKAAERDAKAYLEALKNEVARTSEKWSLFKELADATGDRDLAMKIAFDGKAVAFESELEWLKHRIQEEAKKANINMSVSDLLGLGEKQLLDKGVEEKVAKSIGHLIETYNRANKKLSVDTVKGFAEIIKASRNFEEQIAAIDAKLQEDLTNLKVVYKDNPTALNFAEAEAKKRAEEEKSKVRFEQFKEDSNWVKIFDDLDRVSANTIYGMIDRIEEFAKSTNLSQDEVKQLMDALGKLREKTFDFNPFGSLADSIKRVNELRNMTKKTNAYGVTLYDRGEGYGANRYMTEEEYGNALQSAESDIVKSINGISNKFDDLKNVLDPLVDLFGGADTVFGKIIGGLSNALGGASSMGSSINNLANLKFGGKELGSILGLGGNAGFWGAVAGAGISIATTLMDVFGADYSSYNKMKEEYDILLGVWDSLIERKQKYIDIDYADEGRKVGQEALELLNKQIEAYRILGKERLNAGASAGSHSIGVRIKKGMSEEGWEQYNKAMKSMGLNADWVAKDRMESLFNLSGEQLAELQEKAPVFWAKLDEDVREYLNNIIESNEALEEMRKTLNETLTGTSLDSFYDNYISMLQDLDSSNLEFAQSFEEYLKNAIIANVIGNKYKDSITKLYEDWAAYSDSNKDNVFDLTPEESDALKKAQESLTEQLIAEREALKEAFGWTDSNSASSGLSKGIQGVSEDTANLLASYLNAVRGDVSVERTLVEKLVADDIPRINYLVEAQLTQLNAIASNTLRNANAADKIYDLISRMSDKGGNKWRI